MRPAWLSFIYFQISAVLWAASAVAEQNLAPIPMEISTRWSLGENIKDIGFFSDTQHVYTLSGQGEPTLKSWLLEDLQRDPKNAEPLASIRLSGGRNYQIKAFGEGLVLLIDQERQLEIALLSVDLKISSQKRFDVNGTAQKMTALTNGLIAIPILEGRETRILSFSTKDEIVMSDHDLINHPVGAVWYNPKLSFLYSNSLLSTLFFSMRENLSGSTAFGYSGPSVPYAVNLRHYTYECSQNATDFARPMIIADYSLGTVNAITFEGAFNEFEVKALVQIRPGRSKGSSIDNRNDLNVLETPVLLTANCDRSRILLGSTNSKEIVQMSYNPSFEVMDVSESLKIEFFPDFLKLSKSGNRALVASGPTGQIRIFSEAEISKSAEETTRSGAAREIQRMLTTLGYSVGVIDGKAGPRTNRALDRFLKDRKVEVPRGDISKLAETLKELTREEIKLIKP